MNRRNPILLAAAMSVLLMISVLLVVYVLNLAGRARWALRHG